MISQKNRTSRGPAWASEPFTHINTEFWQDHINKQEFLQEAINVRDFEENRFRIEVPHRGDRSPLPVNLDFQFANSNTPCLAKYFEKFKAWFGDTGRATCHYFYIDGGTDYEWHRDNVLSNIEVDVDKLIKKSNIVDKRTGSEIASNFSVNCCINLVLTEDGSECEFINFGSYKYTAGILNTSHLHRVFPAKNRILARISFVDLIYEEVVHRIRKLERNKK